MANANLLADTNLFVDDSQTEGRPVVLIHGWPLSARSWSAQTDALLGAGYRVVSYDRRGFGRSGKDFDSFDYDALADDLAAVLQLLDLRDVTLIGFSMGGGEVARYLARHGDERIHSVVFAGSVTPYLATTEDNPDGPLDDDLAQQMETGLRADRPSFFDGFTIDFFTAGDELKVSKQQQREAVELCLQSDEQAALGCLAAFGTTDFRDDLTTVTVATLVIHGDSDAVVPFEGSGRRTHEAIEGSELVVVNDAPHGFNVSHAAEFNAAVIDFLAR